MQHTHNGPWLEPYLDAVHQFNRDIIGFPIPDAPQKLDKTRSIWAQTVLTEELTELKEADTIEDQADALVDIAYFALGRLIEMGIVPGIVFEEVHEANMRKVRGEMSKRPGAQGYDAVKLEGWTAPALEPYLTLTKSVLTDLTNYAALNPAVSLPDAYTSQMDTPKPKILIIGEARHGKDTVAEIFRDEYGFQFTSSSLFCAEKVVYAAIKNPASALKKHAEAGSPGMSVAKLECELEIMAGVNYASAEECFNGRSEFRPAWYSLIASHCFPDKATLGREIFAENDLYVGIRNPREFHAVRNAGLADLVIWVDASERCPPEGDASMNLKPWMADFIIDNNGGPDELRNNVVTLLSTLGIKGLDE